MKATNKLPCSEFWTSPETRKTIVETAKGINVEIPTDVEPWQFMVKVMGEYHNFANEYQLPDCHACLFMFVDLFLIYGSRLEKRWGADWVEIPAKAFQKDNLSLAFMRFLEEILAADRVQAHLAFRRVLSGTGLRFKMPGGRTSFYRSRDFGIEFLIGLTAKIDTILASQQKKEDLKANVTDMQERRRMPLVILDWDGVDRIIVLYKQKKIPLTPTQSKLIVRLVLEKGAVPYKDLWEYLYPKAPYQSADSGPPSKLKTHKKMVVDRLQTNWDSAPDGRDWILAQKHTGYFLNTSVKWQFAKEARQNTPEYFLPPRDIDNFRRREDDD